MTRVSRQLDKLKTAEDLAEDLELTDKQKKFAYEYVKDRVISRAAERAGVSRKTGERCLKNKRFLSFIEHIESRSYLAGLSTEPEQLKGQMHIWADANIQDFADVKTLQDLKSLSRSTASCVKKIKCKTKLSPNGEIEEQEVTIELHDALKANALIANPHGIYEQIKIDLSLLDIIDPEDIEMIRKKYGVEND